MHTHMSIGPVILFLAIGYVLGSIPFGLILTRLAGLGDIRDIGSGNIGATNVLRTGNKGLAAATLLGDALKGTLAVYIAWHWGLFPALAAALGAFLGHIFSFWLKFKGGKGVATYIGVLLGLSPWLTACFAIIWLFVATVFRYSSAAALTAMAVIPVLAFIFSNFWIAGTLCLLSALSWWRHKENIVRLKNGTETKIGKKKV